MEKRRRMPSRGTKKLTNHKDHKKRKTDRRVNGTKIGGGNETINLGTWNVRGTYVEGALKQLIKVLKMYRIDILAIQETKQGNNDVVDLDGYTFFKSSGNDRRLGVGFMVGEKMRTKVIGFKPISDRMCTLRLKGGHRKITIINVHAPTEEQNIEVKECYYETLDKICDGVSKHDCKLVMGDWNAKVGQEEIYQPTIGKYSLHDQSNENGRFMIDFAMGRDMKIKSTCYEHRNIHKGTWMSPDGRNVNQIDHILVERRDEYYIQDIRSYRGADADSDHFMVRMKMKQINLMIAEKKMESMKKKSKRIQLRNIQEQIKYAEEMEKTLVTTGKHIGKDAILTVIQESINKVVKNQSKECVKTRKEWYDKQCEDEIKKRGAARERMLRTKSEEHRKKYEEQRKRCKKIIREKKREYNIQKLVEIEEKYRNREIRNFYQGVKKVKKGYQPRTTFCKDKDGNLVGTKEKITERWAEYFQELLSTQQINSENRYVEQIYREEENLSNEVPKEEEILEVIRGLKNNRSAGEDGNQAEMIKYGGRKLHEMIVKLIQEIWKNEDMPKSWRVALICPIHKKGDKTECGNYRGIALLNVMYKILSTCIKNKLRTYAEDRIGEYQSGFRKDRSVTDQIFALKEIQATSHEYRLNTYALFLDFKQAYDTIIREEMYEAMYELEIPAKLIRLTKMTLDETQNRVRVNGELSREFIADVGLRQGDPLSPVLFNLALERVIRRANLNRDNTIFRRKHQCLAFADDLTILTRTRVELGETVRKLLIEAKKMGLEVNERKTKYMIWEDTPFRPKQTLNVKLNESQMLQFEEVEFFNYLGTVITRKPSNEQELKARIAAGTRSSYSMKAMLNSKIFSRTLKLRLYKTIIRPTVTYGCEVWNLRKQDRTMLEVWERKILRRIFGGKEVNGWWIRRTNKELEELYGEQNIVGYVKTQRLRWLGHLTRMKETRVPKKIWEVDFVGTKRRGRPRSRWWTEVQEDLNMMDLRDWEQKARNRKQWNHVIKQAMGLLGL